MCNIDIWESLTNWVVCLGKVCLRDLLFYFTLKFSGTQDLHNYSHYTTSHCFTEGLVFTSSYWCDKSHTDINRIVFNLFSDTLFRNDLQRLVRENSKMSHSDLAIFLRNYLDRNYPKQYWVVTVYDPVKGFDKHTFVSGDRVGYKLRYFGVNYVVFRYPKYATRSPRVPISRVIGAVTTGSDAKIVWSSIEEKFAANSQRFAFIHVIRKIKQYSQYIGVWYKTSDVLTNYYTAKSQSFPSQNYFHREFSDFVVIAVAPWNYV